LEVGERHSLASHYTLTTDNDVLRSTTTLTLHTLRSILCPAYNEPDQPNIYKYHEENKRNKS